MPTSEGFERIGPIKVRNISLNNNIKSITNLFKTVLIGSIIREDTLSRITIRVMLFNKTYIEFVYCTIMQNRSV